MHRMQHRILHRRIARRELTGSRDGFEERAFRKVTNLRTIGGLDV